MYELYWGKNSAALAPEAVLEEAGLPYEKVLIDFKRKETRSPDYLAINPAGYLPALITPEGDILYESATIVLYLCDRHQLDLAPRPGERERGLFYRSLFYMTNTVQEAYKLYYYPERYAGDGADLQATCVQALALLLERWAVVDRALAAAGPFLLGERFSAADIYLAMLVTWHPEEAEFLARFAGIKRCFEAACARPIFGRVIAAHRAD